MRYKLAAIFGAGLLAAACQAPTPVFNTYYYENVGEMNRLGYATGLAAIEPAKEPVGGKLLVVIPSDASIAEKVFSAPEREQIGQMGEAAKAASTASATKHYRNNYQFFADAIRKKGLFSEVTTVSADFGKEPALGSADVMHWFAPRDTSDTFWFMGRDGVKRPMAYRPSGGASGTADFFKTLGASYTDTVEQFVRTNYAPGK